MKPSPSWWQDPWPWALALWGAGLSLLAFPPADLWPLVLVGPAPLWASCALAPACGRSAARRGFLRGWFYGFGFFAALVWWIVPTVTRYGGLPLPAGWACLVLLAAYLALYPAAAAAIFSLAFFRRPAWAFALVPLLWTSLEAVRGSLFSGFPWGDLPQALWQARWALDLAPWIAIDGVRVLLAASSALLGWLLARGFGAPVAPLRKTWPGLLPAALCAAVAAVLLALPAPRAPTAGEVRVGVAQGNIDQAVKWDPSFRAATLRTYVALTREAAAEGAEFVLWPETAVPYYVQDPSLGRVVVEALARETRSHILFGAPGYAPTPAREGRNAVFLASPEAGVVGRYDKVHLVPFGEYMPLGWLFPFATKLVQGVGDFVPGPGAVPLPARSAVPSIGPLVCFEVIFPELSADHAAAGAQLLAVVTNDGWFGKTPGPYQHLAFAAWRAAETGLPLVRAANTGISAAFDSRGTLLRSTGLLEPAVFTLPIPYPVPHRTPAMAVRPWIAPVSAVLALLGLFAMLTPFRGVRSEHRASERRKT